MALLLVTSLALTIFLATFLSSTTVIQVVILAVIIVVIMVVITSVVMFMLVIILVIKFMQVIILVNLLNVDNHNDNDVYGHIRISMSGSAGELDVSHHLEADPQNHLLQPPSSSSHLKPGARRPQRLPKQWSSSAQLKAKLND